MLYNLSRNFNSKYTNLILWFLNLKFAFIFLLLNFNLSIGAEWIWKKFYRNTRYFCQIFFCQKVRFLPPFLEIPPRKREFSFGKTEIAKGILFSQKRIPFFEGEFLGKGVKTSLSDKKYLAEISCITVKFVSDSFSTYNSKSLLYFINCYRLW